MHCFIVRVPKHDVVQHYWLLIEAAARIALLLHTLGWRWLITDTPRAARIFIRLPL